MQPEPKARPASQERPETDREAYEEPAVIYEGTISTRAGTPTGIQSDEGSSGADPADLFQD